MKTLHKILTESVLDNNLEDIDLFIHDFVKDNCVSWRIEGGVLKLRFRESLRYSPDIPDIVGLAVKSGVDTIHITAPVDILIATPVAGSIPSLQVTADTGIVWLIRGTGTSFRMADLKMEAPRIRILSSMPRLQISRCSISTEKLYIHLISKIDVTSSYIKAKILYLPMISGTLNKNLKGMLAKLDGGEDISSLNFPVAIGMPWLDNVDYVVVGDGKLKSWSRRHLFYKGDGSELKDLEMELFGDKIRWKNPNYSNPVEVPVKGGWFWVVQKRLI